MMNELVETLAKWKAGVDDWDEGDVLYAEAYRAEARAVIATIGAGLTTEHVSTLRRMAGIMARSECEPAVIRLNQVAAVIAAIVEANRHD